MKDFANDASGQIHKWLQVQVELRLLIEIKWIPELNLFFYNLSDPTSCVDTEPWDVHCR